jgi:cytoskeletal protein CcmA (bactofilin family)
MFSKRISSFKEVFDTVIGANSNLEGNINSNGSVRIDGKVKGDINADGDISIGNEANVIGNIIANNVQLSGAVKGNIQITGLLKLFSTGRIYGDIQVKDLVADEGAVFQGKCTMVEVPQIEGSDKKLLSKGSSQNI